MHLEVEISSLRILMDAKLKESERAKLEFELLNLISEKRLIAICHRQLNQSRMAKAYNKKIGPMLFKEEDLILKKILPTSREDQSK
jgi:hypothetical protein